MNNAAILDIITITLIVLIIVQVTLFMRIALITLSPILGLPFSWARLSVIGSVAYELTAANFGADAMGVALGQDGYTVQAFLNSIWTMTIGSSVMISFTIFFSRSRPGFKWLQDFLFHSA